MGNLTEPIRATKIQFHKDKGVLDMFHGAFVFFYTRPPQGKCCLSATGGRLSEEVCYVFDLRLLRKEREI